MRKPTKAARRAHRRSLDRLQQQRARAARWAEVPEEWRGQWFPETETQVERAYRELRERMLSGGQARSPIAVPQHPVGEVPEWRSLADLGWDF